MMTNLVWASIKKELAYIAFPFIAVKMLSTNLVKGTFFGLLKPLKMTRNNINVRKLSVVLPLWYMWSINNPWKNDYYVEKYKMLRILYAKYGDRIVYERTIMPRWWNESYINHLIRMRYRRKMNGTEAEYDVPYKAELPDLVAAVEETSEEDED